MQLTRCLNTMFAIIGLALKCGQVILAQSSPFLVQDSVWLRVQSATPLNDSPRARNLSGTTATAAPGVLLGTFTRYSWPVMVPNDDHAASNEVASIRNSESNQDGSVRFDQSKPDTILFFERLRRWRIDLTDGLGITSRNHAYRLALDYSDIFEASRFPDTGGHGMSLLFRYSFEKHRELARLEYR